MKTNTTLFGCTGSPHGCSPAAIRRKQAVEVDGGHFKKPLDGPKEDTS